MKILLDHNLDRRLKNYLTEFDCSTTLEMGWSNASNGELLRLAENDGFKVILTADSNIKSQQNLTGRVISIVVLRARNNRLVTHLEMLDDVERALSNIGESEIVEVYQQR